jgi:hypothetical protein
LNSFPSRSIGTKKINNKKTTTKFLTHPRFTRIQTFITTRSY